jgi:hypothetical protein
MVRRRAVERWETKLANCEVTPQAIWPIAKSSQKGVDQSTICNSWSLRPIFYPIDKANIIADCLDDQFRAHDLHDCDNRRHVEADVEALLATVDEDTPVNF